MLLTNETLSVVTMLFMPIRGTKRARSEPRKPKHEAAIRSDEGGGVASDSFLLWF